MVVEMSDPTVSCDDVAIRTPLPFVVTMEFGGKVAKDEKGTLETLKALPEYDRPVPAVVVAPLETSPPKTARPPSERVER